MIQLSHIEKTYASPAGPVHALKGIDLTIDTGEIYGIIGLSGAGKSTLIRCINLLERPTAGQVLIDGQDMLALSEKELREARKDIGMIFQHFNLLSSATVYDNVAFPLRLAGRKEADIRAKVESLLELVGLANKAQQYPSQLSGGQKQRVGIARALASEPQILLCDEATSALDPQTTKAILELIRDINQKMHLTVVIITHEMGVIKEICNKVAVIANGVIAEQGSVLDVFMHPQQDITKEFVSVVLSNDLPAAFRQVEILPEPAPDTSLLLRLTFIGENADEPVIADTIKKFPELAISILFGDVNEIQNVPFGRLIIGISGEQARIDEALQYLGSRDLQKEVIGYVRQPA